MIADECQVDVSSYRTDYVDGRVLSASALETDSAELVAASQRAQRMAHRNGVVGGLWIEAIQCDTNSEKIQITVHPGAAIDPCGRLLLCDRDQRDCKINNVAAFAVWLRYREHRINA